MNVVRSIESGELVKAIHAGKIFMYPTDTIYGLGCDATNEKAVAKIKKIKQRDAIKPLSVIAPSFDWIKKNFIIDVDLERYLPGPYTVVLKKKEKNFLQWILHGESIGVRIPDTSFTKQIQAAGVPFVTTSVNFAGEAFAKRVSDISPELKKAVDYIIDAGVLQAKPSTLIMNGKEIERK